MSTRERQVPVYRPATGRLCIVMVCTDISEADQVGRQLSEVNTGCLVTYRRMEDLMYSSPTGKVALVILATDDKPAVLSRMLKWLGRRWPSCPVTVVGDEGCGDYEMAARIGGANYLTRPVAPQQWSAVLSHVLREQAQAEALTAHPENRPGSTK